MTHREEEGCLQPDEGHHHDHGHGHAHTPANFGHAFAIGIALNTAFVIAEVIFGLAAHSMALVADAGHNLSDVLSLGLAWGASILTTLPPSKRFTYGLKNTSILAALVNAILLLVVMGGVAWEAVRRLGNPEHVSGGTVIWVAALGIIINGITALLFFSGRKGDLNIGGAFLHMAGDAAVSLGVSICGLVILKTSWQWLDPVASLIITTVIIIGTWGLLRDAVGLSLNAVPPQINSQEVHGFLRSLKGVIEVHDLHIWGMSTTETALTAHLVMPPASLPDDEFLSNAAHELREKFRIGHSTIQIECGSQECKQAPDNVV